MLFNLLLIKLSFRFDCFSCASNIFEEKTEQQKTSVESIENISSLISIHEPLSFVKTVKFEFKTSKDHNPLVYSEHNYSELRFEPVESQTHECEDGNNVFSIDIKSEEDINKHENVDKNLLCMETLPDSPSEENELLINWNSSQYEGIFDIGLFFDSNWLNNHLLTSLKKFLNAEQKNSFQPEKNNFNESFIANIQSNIQEWDDLKFDANPHAQSHKYFRNYFNFLVRFFLSILESKEPLILYFESAFGKECINENVLKELITKKVYEIISNPKLRYLKTYLPELYGLENMPEKLKFSNVQSAIIGYLVIFCMQFPFETDNTDNIFIHKPGEISDLSIFDSDLNNIIKFGCWFKLFLFCLDEKEIYISNYNDILAGLISLKNGSPKFSWRYNNIKHTQYFFKKIFLFYFINSLVSKNLGRLTGKKCDCEVCISKNINLKNFFPDIFEMLENFKIDFKQLMTKYDFIKRTYDMSYKVIDYSQDVYLVSCFVYYCFTSDINEFFNVSELKGQFKSKV